MSVEIQTILNYIEEYASNEHPPKEEGYIIPLQLGYVDSILLIDYIYRLQEIPKKALDYTENMRDLMKSNEPLLTSLHVLQETLRGEI